MADYFNYTFNDGTEVNVELPEETGFECSHSRPSSRMKNFAAEISAYATHSTDEHETEDYCQAAAGIIENKKAIAQNIKDEWDQMEINCANCKGLCKFLGACVCRCKDKGMYCYKSENSLEDAYWSWAEVPQGINGHLQVVLGEWKKASDQIALDGQQATNQAFLDQLIAQTNNEISIAAYQNDQRELQMQVAKTGKYFAPLLIGIILIGVAFYFIKRK